MRVGAYMCVGAHSRSLTRSDMADTWSPLEDLTEQRKPEKGYFGARDHPPAPFSHAEELFSSVL